MKIADLWFRFKRLASLASLPRESEPGLYELTPDDVSAVLASCFGLGKGYFLTEAGHCEKTGNPKGQQFNVARARLCDELYSHARADAGKQKGTTSDELAGRSLATP